VTENIGTTAPSGPTVMRWGGNFADFKCVMICEPTFEEPRRARREALWRTRPEAKPEQRVNIAESVMLRQPTAIQMVLLYKVGEPGHQPLARRPSTRNGS
jgi:hypothetical protein